MARELMLLRHAKSDWSEDVSDFNRPLKKRGRKAAIRMGEWLLKQHLLPDLIVSSPAVRAQETAKQVCKGLNIERCDDILHLDERIYETDLSTLKKVLADCPSLKKRILLIGHNPALEELLRYLVDSPVPDQDGKLLATTTLAIIEMPDDWKIIPPQIGLLKIRKRAKYLSLHD